MDRFFNGVLKHKKTVLIIFSIVVVICAILFPFVSVNYKMVDYLPSDSQSTTAIKIMEQEFGGEMPNARVMLTNVSVLEALEFKEKISQIDGVTSVDWLDDVMGLDTIKNTPVEFLDESITRNYYKDNNALMTLSISGGKESSAVNKIYSIIGEKNAAAGEAVTTAETQAMSVSEVVKAMVILVPVIIIILIISTTSWVEPLLFLFSIGVAIIINMGTNIVFGEVSFITRTVSPVLQLAVSLDYAIFLLHSFNEHRRHHDPERAMLLAMKEALPTVAASAATTVIGFAALMFMRFGIGADLGVNLLKGIIFSFISVMIFLPVLTLMYYKVIDKTRHRKLMPDFRKSGKWLMKVRLPFLALAVLLSVPCFLAQANTEFMYGMGSITGQSRAGKDSLHIEEKFGKENPMVLLVPKDDPGKELILSDALGDIPHVTSVVSFVTAVGAEIPTEFVPKEALQQFYSEKYSRIILYTDTPEEGEQTFSTVAAILNTTGQHYESYYLAGQSATLYDMRNVVSTDNEVVNLIAVIGIFFVLLITFRSLVLPLFLIFTIETAIWINLSFPYFADQPLTFIGYLIISTVQLGATVDYAILFTNSYMNNRKTLPKKEAMRTTIGDNLIAIVISAGILATAGFALASTSSNPVIGELGTLLGRGTLLSLFMVSCVLPAILVLFDKLIHMTTLKRKSKHT